MKKILNVMAVLLLAVPPARAADKTVFVPTSSWLAGPASPVLAAGTETNLPCVMINQYDNGYTFRISGGGGHIFAMAIDFRQKVFKPGKSYRLDMEVPPYVDVALPAAAYDETTLLLNTQQIDGFYKNLSEAETMKIRIGDAAMTFSLLGVAEGLSRVEGCYGAPPQKPAAGKQPAVRQSAVRPPVAAPRQPVEALPPLPPADSVITPLPEEESAVAEEYRQPATATMAGSAAGQNEIRPPQDIEPAAGPAAGAEPARPVRQEGQMLARSWASPFAPANKNATARGIMVSQPGAAPREVAGKRRDWRALRGTSLEESLRVWSEAADVAFVWMAGEDFPVARTAGLQGTYEEAVAGLLGQYENDSVRPVGRLYNDPRTGRKVLLVEVHRAGGG